MAPNAGPILGPLGMDSEVVFLSRELENQGLTWDPSIVEQHLRAKELRQLSEQELGKY